MKAETEEIKIQDTLKFLESNNREMSEFARLFVKGCQTYYKRNHRLSSRQQETLSDLQKYVSEKLEKVTA